MCTRPTITLNINIIFNTTPQPYLGCRRHLRSIIKPDSISRRQLHLKHIISAIINPHRILGRIRAPRTLVA